MDCPTCGKWTEVKDSRPRDDNTRYRRYECGNGHRFSTLETVLPPDAARQASVRNMAKARQVYKAMRGLA